MNDVTNKIKLFLATNPNDEQIEEFYIYIFNVYGILSEKEDIYNCWLCGNEIEYIDNGICKGCHTQTRDIN
jgi:hypothetical protein